MRRKKQTGRLGDTLRVQEMLALLLSLVFMLLCVPVVDAFVVNDVLPSAGLSIVIASVVWAVRHREGHLRFSLGVIVFLLPILWTSLFLHNRWLFALSSILSGLFFLGAAIAIAVRVFRQHLATFQGVCGAIVVYLLLGLSWAMLYWAIVSVDETAILHHGVVEASGATVWLPPMTISEVIYFSFVTMSTLGYGDMAPTHAIAQSAAWMQSVLGQFYIAIFVARLVSMLPRPEKKNHSP